MWDFDAVMLLTGFLVGFGTGVLGVLAGIWLASEMMRGS
jgi:hypothetical protein